MSILNALLLLAPLPALPPGATPPVPVITPFDAINPEDFPTEADPDDRALIEVRLDIDTRGRIRACTALEIEAQGRWTAQRFLDLTCKLLRERVRFAPARDINGRAIASVYVDGIAWDRIVAIDGRLIKGPPIAPRIWPQESLPPPPLPPKPSVEPRPAKPMGNAAGWIGPLDYPAKLKNGEAGVTRYRLTVGPDGRIAACTIVKSSGVSRLDETTCSLITRRARFSPANDKTGAPVQGAWNGKFEWKPPQ